MLSICPIYISSSLTFCSKTLFLTVVKHWLLIFTLEVFHDQFTPFFVCVYWPSALRRLHSPIYTGPSLTHLQTTFLSSALLVVSPVLLLWDPPHPSPRSLQVQSSFLHPPGPTAHPATPARAWPAWSWQVQQRGDGRMEKVHARHGLPAMRGVSRRQNYSEITALLPGAWLSLASTHLIQKSDKHFKM